MTSMRDRPSPNHGPRRDGAVIDMLILHYTGMPTGSAALDRLCDPKTDVSAHYVIGEDGTVWHLVAEDRRAWHAGRGYWAGETDINSRSIGIELVNPGHEHGYRPFPEPQMAALIALSHDILLRHAIPAHRVLGHSDIAPDRKQDPGELFGWRRLASDGIGLWSDAVAGDTAGFVESMRRFGYADASAETIRAFQRHFRPAGITGIADGETAARLADLVRQAGLA